MQLNKGKRETRASARNEQRYYLSLPSTAFEYRSQKIRFSLFACYLDKNCHWPVLPGFRGSLPPHPCKASGDHCTQATWYMFVCVYASMNACVNIPGSRYCNFKDRSGIADRYSDPKYRFRPRNISLTFTEMSSFRPTRISSGVCSTISADFFRETIRMSIFFNYQFIQFFSCRKCRKFIFWKYNRFYDLLCDAARFDFSIY